MVNATVDVRLRAAQTIAAVNSNGNSLASLMAPAQQQLDSDDQALLQLLCYGTLRWQPRLQSLLQRLLEKPLRNRDSDVSALLLLGLFQLEYLRTPEYAAIDSTVAAAKKLRKPWAGRLVNAILRSYQRRREELHASLATSPAFQTAHPNWLRKSIEKHWPDTAATIMAANNDHPPMTLRVNTAASSRADYLQRLREKGLGAQPTTHSRYGITLDQAVPVGELPGFYAGEVSVQDEAAQLTADLLNLQPGQRVLDACCAPGGKLGHILEVSAQLAAPLGEVWALDLEPRRLQRVEENLKRITPCLQRPTALRVLAGDAGEPEQWWDGRPFDRILLDAPCSATGVVRRHPDIKILRKATDIAKLAAIQTDLLRKLWPCLRPGGTLIYATCSILPTENGEVIDRFVAATGSARCSVMDVPWGQPQGGGRQLLPQSAGHDGFYYACLQKSDTGCD